MIRWVVGRLLSLPALALLSVAGLGYMGWQQLHWREWTWPIVALAGAPLLTICLIARRRVRLRRHARAFDKALRALQARPLADTRR